MIENKIILDFKKNYKDLTKKNLSKMQECVFKDIYNLSLDNKKELENFFLSQNLIKGKIKKYSEIKTKIINYFKNETVTKKLLFLNFQKK